MVKYVGRHLPLTSLHHISLCNSVDDSINFYENVLFNYGVGIHLLQTKNPEDLFNKSEINPRDNHLSFQCESMQVVEMKLQDMEIKYIKRRVEEGGLYVDQLFIHHPDGFMIEMCNCENLPVVPLTSTSHACRFRSAIDSKLQMILHMSPPKQQQQKLVEPPSVPQEMLMFSSVNPGHEVEFGIVI
eukprot:PITA_35011